MARLMCAGLCLLVATSSWAFSVPHHTCFAYSLIAKTGVVEDRGLLKQVNATTLSECCDACHGTPTCLAWTFMHDRDLCRLASAVYNRWAKETETSGLRRDAATCVPVMRPPAPAPSSVPIGQRPNFVTLLIDDLGYDDLRSHNHYPTVSSFTPNAEALMREGVTLGRHHSYMWCSPTRRACPPPMRNTCGQGAANWRRCHLGCHPHCQTRRS